MDPVEQFFTTGHVMAENKYPVVRVFFVRPQPGTSGQPDKQVKSVEIHGMDAYGIVTKAENENVATFYPWPSIDRIQ